MNKKITTPKIIANTYLSIGIPSRFRWKIIYGKISSCPMPCELILKSTFEEVKKAAQIRYNRIVEINPPDIILEEEKERFEKVKDFETYSSTHPLAKAIKKIKK